jgi:tripartite-type tricarboxylate transporter receptor subunit TctC
MRYLSIAVAIAAALGPAGHAFGQAYPAQAITMVVAGPAGGPTDAIGRILAGHMHQSLGQPVLIENRPASGGIALGRVGHAKPDGYTIGLGHWGTHVVDGAILDLPFDPLNDFEPVSLIAFNPLLILSKNAVPAKDLKELIAWLKANPGKASLGTAGPGSPPQVAGVFFQKLTGTRFQFVPYRGAAPAMQDLIAGQIDLNMPQAAIALPQIAAGTIRAYAVTSKTRLASAPAIPTVDEAGAPGLYISVWHGLWAPKNTPRPVVARLNSAVVSALADSTVRRRLAELGQDIPAPEQQTPDALGEFQKAEIAKWWPIIKAANIKGE